MALLFTDLDRTLLWSHRFDTGRPRIWVEFLQGRPQSWMTEETWNFFSRQTWLEVVPLTTRTRAQYARLEPAFARLGWKRALICNGAMLLEGGREDPAWRQQSLELAAPARRAFHAALDLARRLAGEESVVCTEPFQFYLKGSPSPEICALLEGEADSSLLTILPDARKLYCFPSVLHKGAALERYVERFGGSPVYGAGDSLFDLPMLQRVDRAFCPRELAPLLPGASVTPCPGSLLGDTLCAALTTEHETRL